MVPSAVFQELLYYSPCRFSVSGSITLAVSPSNIYCCVYLLLFPQTRLGKCCWTVITRLQEIRNKEENAARRVCEGRQRWESFHKPGHWMENDPSSRDCEAADFLMGISLLGEAKGRAGLFTRLIQGRIPGDVPWRQDLKAESKRAHVDTWGSQDCWKARLLSSQDIGLQSSSN